MSRPDRRRRQRDAARFPNEQLFTQHLTLRCPSCRLDLGRVAADWVALRLHQPDDTPGRESLTLAELGQVLAWRCPRASQPGHGPGHGRVPTVWVLRILDAMRHAGTSPHSDAAATRAGLGAVLAELVADADDATRHRLRRAAAQWRRTVDAVPAVAWRRNGDQAGPALTDAQLSARLDQARAQPALTWDQLTLALAVAESAGRLRAAIAEETDDEGQQPGRE